MRVGKFFPIERYDDNRQTYIIEYSTGEIGLYVLGYRNFATNTGLVFRGTRERLAELDVEIRFSGMVRLTDKATGKLVPHAFAGQAKPPLV